MRALLLAGVLGVFLAGCNNVVTSPTDDEAAGRPGGSGGGTVPPREVTDLIEYRVTGTPATVLIRYSTSEDGLTQTSTAIPWGVSFKSSRASIFLTIEATPISTGFSAYPFLSAQIYINGTIFREASSTSYAGVAIQGTWRR